MTPSELLLVAAIAAAAYIAFLYQRRGLGRYEGRRIVVHTVDEQSIDAVLVSVFADGLELADGKVLGGSSGAVELQGRVFVPRQNIAFIQWLQVGGSS